MDIKALMFGYCSKCEGVSITLGDYLELSELGCGEVKHDCAFHPPTHTEVKTACRKCADTHAIVKFPIIYSVEEAINLITVIDKKIEELKDRAVRIVLDSYGAEKIYTEGLKRESSKFYSEFKELNSLRRAILGYRFNTNEPQNYWHRGTYK